LRTLGSVQKAVTYANKDAIEADFQSRYNGWKISWAKCLASEGGYSERDHFELDETFNK
jgi:hypothetical protein